MEMFSYRRKIKRDYEKLLESLDRILDGEMIDETYDESLDAAIIDRLNRIMNRVELRQDRAEEERDKVKQLISDISHQVRTPLSNVVLYSELLEESFLQDGENPSLKLVSKIRKNAEALSFQLQELLKASYSEQEMIHLHPMETNVCEIVKEACQRVEDFAMKEGISMHINVQEETVLADFKWTVEALFNVIHNAVKYSERDSEIQIEEEIYESFVCIRVKDFGVGIPEEEVTSVCNRFYRGSNVSNEPGIGIGLYLTREVLQKQKGYLKIDTKEGFGTCVSLFLHRAY